MNDEPAQEKDPRPPPPARYRLIMRVEAPVNRLLGMSCRHFAGLAVARLDRPLSLGERLRYRMHGRLCSLCRGFSGQLQVLAELSRELEEEQAGSLQDPEVQRIVEDVRRKLGGTKG
jgi:hypothetical protein